MGTLLVVKLEPLAKTFSKLGSAVKRPKIKILIFDGPPQPLDENIILDPASAVHTDFNVMLYEQPGKCLAGKLGSLVGVENIRFSIPLQGFLKSRYAEIGAEGVGDPP